MRRSRFLLIALFLLLTASIVLVVYLKRRGPSPTQFKWLAHINRVAGEGSPLFSDVADPTKAGFSDPFGIAVAPDGSVYISDAGESNRIRKVTREGTLVTVAGGMEGSGNVFNTPSALAIDAENNVYAADTGNNRIRKITPEGVVSTLAGSGTAGFADGPAASAQFDGPVGIAVDEKGNVYVADSYNDRIRKISVDGQVTTVAGKGGPGFADGDAANALFDTPCGVVVNPDGSLIVADTGNDKLRRISPTGQVTTLQVAFDGEPGRTWFRSPLGLALTPDGFLYVTEFDRGTIVQVAPDGKACVLAGSRSGYSEGTGVDSRFNHPAGIGIDSRNGDVLVADSANYLVRRLSHLAQSQTTQPSAEQLPRLTPETLGIANLHWPFDPQDRPHEVVATMGEVRGSYDSTDSRDHLHSGLDVFGAYGDVVRVIRSEKVSSPLSNWGINELSEGIRVGVHSYIHIHVGRDKDGNIFNDSRFVPVKGDDGKLSRVRVRRGALFNPGDAIGTVNRMYHVHLIVGPSGGEINPLSLSPVGFKDSIPPTIEKDGIQLFDESGSKLTAKENERLVVNGRVRIVVDAFDRNDMNTERRRLGLYSIGYQVFNATKTSTNSSSNPAPGFPSPRITILFNRLPADNATKIAYAGESGITVYGSKTTRFLYEVTNTVRDGQAQNSFWDTSELPKGDYVLRIVCADYSGNETHGDVSVAVK
jgi:sugar lactone lactonase YvrE